MSGLRVVIITQGVSRVVMPLLSSKHEIIGIVENAPRARRQGLKKRIYELGMGLYQISQSRPYSLRQLAYQRNIPYYYMGDGCSQHLAHWLQNLKPDIFVVYSMSELLKENIFTIPKFGTINLHGSLLPNYRGPEPWLWMYYHMDLHPGTTVHYIDQGEDTGDIICQQVYKLVLGTRLDEWLDYGIGVVGVHLLLQALQAIETGEVVRQKQLDGVQSRAGNIDAEDYAKLIDWQAWTIEHIWHFLRGTERMIDLIVPAGGLFAANRWVVLNYMRCDLPASYQVGKLYRERGSSFLTTREGKIYLAKTFSFKRLLANLTQ